MFAFVYVQVAQYEKLKVYIAQLDRQLLLGHDWLSAMKENWNKIFKDYNADNTLNIII